MKTPPRIITLILMAAISAASLNIFLPSLPKMATDFGVSYTRIQLAVSGYLIITGLLQLFVGPLSDRFGRRKVSIICFSIFGVAALGSALSQDYVWFVGFRFAQATAAAGFVMSRAIINDVYGPKNAASVIGYVTMGMALVPMFTPLLGGVIDLLFGWRANFIALALAGGGLAILLYFDCGETHKISPTPILKQFKDVPELFMSRRFWGYSFASAFSVGCFFAYISGAPFVAINVYGLDVNQAALTIGAPPAGYLIGNGLSGLFSSRVGVPLMVALGCFIQFCFMFMGILVALIFPENAVLFFATAIGIGLGNGISLPSANVGIMNINPDYSGSAVGISGALMTFWGAFFSYLVALLLKEDMSVLPFGFALFISALCAILVALYTWKREVRLNEIA